MSSPPPGRDIVLDENLSFVRAKTSTLHIPSFVRSSLDLSNGRDTNKHGQSAMGGTPTKFDDQHGARRVTVRRGTLGILHQAAALAYDTSTGNGLKRDTGQWLDTDAVQVFLDVLVPPTSRDTDAVMRPGLDVLMEEGHEACLALRRVNLSRWQLKQKGVADHAINRLYRSLQAHAAAFNKMLQAEQERLQSLVVEHVGADMAEKLHSCIFGITLHGAEAFGNRGQAEAASVPEPKTPGSPHSPSAELKVSKTQEPNMLTELGAFLGGGEGDSGDEETFEAKVVQPTVVLPDLDAIKEEVLFNLKENNLLRVEQLLESYDESFDSIRAYMEAQMAGKEAEINRLNAKLNRRQIELTSAQLEARAQKQRLREEEMRCGSIQQENSNLNAQLKTAHKQSERLDADLRWMQQQLMEAQEAVQMQIKMRQELELKDQDEAREMNILHSEIKKLKQCMEEEQDAKRQGMDSLQAQTVEITALKLELKRAESDNKVLQYELEKLQERYSKLEDLGLAYHGEAAQAQRDKDVVVVLKHQAEDDLNDALVQLEQMRTYMVHQQAVATVRVAEMMQRLATTKAELKDTKVQLSETKAELGETELQLSQAKGELVHYKDRVRSMDDDNMRAQKVATEAQKKAKAALMDLGNLQVEFDSLHSKHATSIREYDSMQEELTTLRTAVEVLRAGEQVAKDKEMKANMLLDAHRNALKELAELRGVRASHERLTAELERVQASFDQLSIDFASLGESLQAANSERDEANLHVIRMTEEHDLMFQQTSKLQAELDTAVEERTTLTEQLNYLRNNLSELRSEMEMLEGEVEGGEAFKRTQEEEIGILRSQVHKMEDLQLRLDLMDKDRSEIASQRDAARHAAQTLQSSVTELVELVRREKQHVQHSVQQLQDQVGALHDLMDSSGKEMHQAQLLVLDNVNNTVMYLSSLVSQSNELLDNAEEMHKSLEASLKEKLSQARLRWNKTMPAKRPTADAGSAHSSRPGSPGGNSSEASVSRPLTSRSNSSITRPVSGDSHTSADLRPVLRHLSTSREIRPSSAESDGSMRSVLALLSELVPLETYEEAIAEVRKLRSELGRMAGRLRDVKAQFKTLQQRSTHQQQDSLDRIDRLTTTLTSQAGEIKTLSSRAEKAEVTYKFKEKYISELLKKLQDTEWKLMKLEERAASMGMKNLIPLGRVDRAVQTVADPSSPLTRTQSVHDSVFAAPSSRISTPPSPSNSAHTLASNLASPALRSPSFAQTRGRPLASRHTVFNYTGPDSAAGLRVADRGLKKGTDTSSGGNMRDAPSDGLSSGAGAAWDDRRSDVGIKTARALADIGPTVLGKAGAMPGPGARSEDWADEGQRAGHSRGVRDLRDIDLGSNSVGTSSGANTPGLAGSSRAAIPLRVSMPGDTAGYASQNEQSPSGQAGGRDPRLPARRTRRGSNFKQGPSTSISDWLELVTPAVAQATPLTEQRTKALIQSIYTAKVTTDNSAMQQFQPVMPLADFVPQYFESKYGDLPASDATMSLLAELVASVAKHAPSCKEVEQFGRTAAILTFKGPAQDSGRGGEHPVEQAPVAY